MGSPASCSGHLRSPLLQAATKDKGKAGPPKKCPFYFGPTLCPSTGNWGLKMSHLPLICLQAPPQLP